MPFANYTVCINNELGINSMNSVVEIIDEHVGDGCCAFKINVFFSNEVQPCLKHALN